MLIEFWRKVHSISWLSPRRWFAVVVYLTFSAGLAWHTTSAHAALNDCYAVYDVGSSGTRLYIIQNINQQWQVYKGPKGPALADVVRGVRGKQWADAGHVVTEIALALDKVRSDGPPDKKGYPMWRGFDWKSQCELQTVMALGTAGMRLAGQQDSARTTELWQMLRQKVLQIVGDDMPVQARTLSGFEEGAYSWLAVQHREKHSAFGVIEMGGASAQVVFPCHTCNLREKAVRAVKVDGKVVRLFSGSLLGWGQDEVSKVIGFPEQCRYGAAQYEPQWTEEHCSSQLKMAKEERGQTSLRSDGIEMIPISKSSVRRWYLTGAFSYMGGDDVTRCCLQSGDCFDQKNACFRAVYLRSLLGLFGIPAESEKRNEQWVLGAARCRATHCIEEVE